MYTIWATIIKNNKRIKEFTATSNLENKDYAFSECLTEICYHLDLQQPYLLPNHQRELQEYYRTLLGQDCFIETINFDYLELEIAKEED